ncbi:RNA polymerase sigma factor [Ancylobacter defluvii]|uniref:ECF sigma factor VreI n=1 Tax=Ancylobacter defluvii TaxID=1282440 RepID=A0A9W6NCA7_9HYPH|nr:sigma-70 family RNA polymerase sigma factor [Ancylobacter defluvii]MBS7586323.1 sigma-70 family RNA polymerase sigma factor [Ancylobacter defluvii]GLK85603.1 ECF sigma factor VreI [Ancylobacter defluvii]
MSRKDGLRALFDADRSSVVSFFRRVTGSASLAEDLSQDVFARLAATDIGAIANPQAYLRSVSANIATDLVRRENRRRLTSAEIDDLLEVPDPAADPEARLIAKDRVERMLEALAELPVRRRAILVAARLEGIPHRTLAETHGISTRTVEIEIQKALAHCARALVD